LSLYGALIGEIGEKTDQVFGKSYGCHNYTNSSRDFIALDNSTYVLIIPLPERANIPGGIVLAVPVL
jgi:hypothetical protein